MGGDAVAGLLRFGPGVVEHGHSHQAAHRHARIVDGEGWIAGIRITSGSYIHVPAGFQHATTAGPNGCRMFHVYLPSGG